MGTEEFLKVDTGALLRLRIRRRPLLSNKALDVASKSLLFLLTIFFFAGVLFSDRYAIPWDMIDFYYPSQFYSIESIKNGSLPLWNPHILSGFPTIADPENAVCQGNSVKIAANLDAPGFVVLTDGNYPGWKAYDRGKEKEILPAYGLFRAIALEKRRHSIEFRFEPKIVYVGFVITLISFLLATIYLLILYLPSLRRNRN